MRNVCNRLRVAVRQVRAYTYYFCTEGGLLWAALNIVAACCFVATAARHPLPMAGEVPVEAAVYAALHGALCVVGALAPLAYGAEAPLFVLEVGLATVVDVSYADLCLAAVTLVAACLEDPLEGGMVLEFGLSFWLGSQWYGSFEMLVGLLVWLFLCARVALIFVVLILVRITTPRIRFEALSRLGWYTLLGVVLGLLLLYIVACFWF